MIKHSSLEPSHAVRRAVILAAGRGTRMGQITAETPKPMLPIGGRPILEHILDQLEEAGVHRFLIVVGYHHKLIEKHFKSSKYRIDFVEQTRVNGTARAALLAREFARDQPFILSYGDILCRSTEYVRMQSILENNPAASAIVAVREVEDPWQGAAVYEIGGRITRIVKRPPKGASITRWNGAGFYLLRPVIFDYLANVEPSQRGEYELTSALELMLCDRLELHISPVMGEWRDVGRPEDLIAAEHSFS